MGVGGWLVNRRLMRHELALEKKMNDVCGEELKRKEEEQKKILYATGYDDVCRKVCMSFLFHFNFPFPEKKNPLCFFLCL